MLVADALRLGGAILSVYPDMLAPQLLARLLPEIGVNPNVKMLLRQCDQEGPDDCALLPLYHCLHTPGGPLKVNVMSNMLLSTAYQPILLYKGYGNFMVLNSFQYTATCL